MQQQQRRGVSSNCVVLGHVSPLVDPPRRDTDTQIRAWSPSPHHLSPDRVATTPGEQEPTPKANRSRSERRSLPSVEGGHSHPKKQNFQADVEFKISISVLSQGRVLIIESRNKEALKEPKGGKCKHGKKVNDRWDLHTDVLAGWLGGRLCWEGRHLWGTRGSGAKVWTCTRHRS